MITTQLSLFDKPRYFPGDKIQFRLGAYSAIAAGTIQKEVSGWLYVVLESGGWCAVCPHEVI